MAISEAQFKAMTKGTIHEGRYDVPSNKPKPVQRKPLTRKSLTRKSLTRKSLTRKQVPSKKSKRAKEHDAVVEKAEKAFGEIHTALPYVFAIRMATQPFFWLALVVLALPCALLADAVFTRVYSVVIMLTSIGLAEVPYLFVFILFMWLLCVLLSKIKI